ncbi:MAG TPA: penicillin acylase family protein [Myxococcota bacterium]|nr:penicillin acylase family protein [Myxococcota bacterium]
MWALGWVLVACSSGGSAGPAGSVTVYTDTSGIPHVFAKTERDAFWTQGWLSARDRLMQMELTRRRAQGRRAELLGETWVASDTQSRALRFADWGSRAWARVQRDEPRVAEALTAYADGVNAWIDDAVAAHAGASLPDAMVALDLTPEPWTPADSLAIEKLITAGLSMRPDQDLTLGLMRLLVGPDLFSDLYVYEPFDDEVIAPGWLDEAAAEGLLTQAERGPPASPPPLEVDLPALRRSLAALALGGGGSNNQVIDGAHAANGHTIVLGDSHQGVAQPATYWLVHLDTADAGGDLSLAGATFPGAPLVMFGTNGHVAWTPTTSLLDVSDVWLETWADAERTAVLHDGEAVPVDWRDEVIGVRGEGGEIEERAVPMAEVPHHGPILPIEGLPLPLTVSIAWTGYQPRSTAGTYLALADARDVDEAIAAFDEYFTGGQNWMIGDASGRIAWSAAVDLPAREAIDPEHPPLGLLPGEGGYDWVPGDDAPYVPVAAGRALRRVDPADGLLVSANNDPVGQTLDGDPFNDGAYLSAVFDIGTRARQPRLRLEALIAAGGATLEAARDVQLDTTSRIAGALLPFLLRAAERRPDLVTPELGDLLDRLRGWDLTCPVDAVEPTIFHLWLALAGRDVLGDEAGGLVGDLVFQDMNYQLGLVVVKNLRYWLERTDADIDAIDAGELPFPSRSGVDLFDRRDTEARETRDEVLLGALAEVVPEATRLFGSSDPAAWVWGRWHQLALVDPAEAWAPGASVAPAPKAGGLYTVDVGDYSWFVDGAIPDLALVTNAPSNRFAFELDPAGVRAYVVIPGGQDERAGSRHHDDLLAAYLAGSYVELPLTRADAARASEDRLYLDGR